MKYPVLFQQIEINTAKGVFYALDTQGRIWATHTSGGLPNPEGWCQITPPKLEHK